MLRFHDNIIMSDTTKTHTIVNEKTALSYQIPVFHLYLPAIPQSIFTSVPAGGTLPPLF